LAFDFGKAMVGCAFNGFAPNKIGDYNVADAMDVTLFRQVLKDCNKAKTHDKSNIKLNLRVCFFSRIK
jgi:hypothetical protein